jgi:hypothetical protein
MSIFTTIRAIGSAPLRVIALGRRLRTAALALALSAAFGVTGGASQSLADTGSVYFDLSDNAAAGETLFNGTFTGCCNVGLGRTVMPNLTNGQYNIAIGNNVLQQNTAGSYNVASGTGTLYSNTAGGSNVVVGNSAMILNTTGSYNVANGDSALIANTTGSDNVAAGRSALVSNTTGSDNIALGTGAGQDLTTGSNNIDIANAGKAGEQKVIRIGTKGDQIRAFIAGISGRTVSGTAQPVVVNAQGQLGTASAAKSATAPLSAADARQLMDTVERQQQALKRQQDALSRQQRQIDQLRKQMKGG